MSHKTRVNGTLYDMTGSKCLIGGTGYSVKKGRTLIGGTGYDIALGSKTWLIDAYPPDSSLSSIGNIPSTGYAGPPFISNGNSYLGMSITLTLDSDGENHIRITYWFLYNGREEQMRIYSPARGWQNEAYRTVTFEEEPSGDLLTWLEANAVPQQ